MDKNNDDLPNLDTLRAVAVLLVLGAHTWESMQYLGVTAINTASHYFGRLGVLLFFVHTSFVLMASLARSDAHGWRGAAQFYTRRGFRIYPLAIACILLVVALQVPTMPPLVYSAPSTFDLASNLALTQVLTRSEPIITPLWSLPVELQMYLLLPIIFVLSQRATSVRWIVAAWLVSLVGAFFVFPISDRLLVLQFAPCFLAGVLAYALHQNYLAFIGAKWWMPALCVVVVVYVAIEAITPGTHHVALQSAICLALGVALPFFGQSKWRRFNRVTHVVAKYSYGIYLFHVVALWLGFFAFKMPFAAGAVVATGSIVVMAVVGYHLIENPMMRVGAKLAKSLRVRHHGAVVTGSDALPPMRSRRR